MKTCTSSSRISTTGNALVITMIMTAVALIVLSGILSWSSGNARLAARSYQYNRAIAAAEAATEKINSAMASDYLNAGEAQVIANLPSYRLMIPTGADSSYWTNFQFNDAQGNADNTFVQQGAVSNYQVLTGAYAGLTGFASTYHVVSDASEAYALQSVTAGVLEDIQLTRIPIFQFAMYSSGEMEVSCGKPFVVNGPVHSNGQLYVEPDNLLTFQSGVTAVQNVVFGRDPLDTRGNPAGSVTYDVPPQSGQPALTLPIGTTNTPQAVREIIEPPAPFESVNSAIGRERYFNQCDMILSVYNTSNRCQSGLFNAWSTIVPSNEVASFVFTNSTFYDWREHKTVYPIDISVSWLTNLNATNNTDMHLALHRCVRSLYIYDQRTLPNNCLRAVRLINGVQLPPLGLTVATHDPLYVLGNYNQPVMSNLNTANVTTTLPASLVADAITILSVHWTDGMSGASSVLLTSTNRAAQDTTVNAAILSGEMDTVAGTYSGGMENFPRFLENWTPATFTYNGSMVKMFPSLYATNLWGQGNVYNPPSRNWTYDTNFNIPSELPPLTPSLQVVSRSQWAALAPNQTTAP